VSWKWSEKTAQFKPEALSFRTDDGRVLAREVTLTEEDIVDAERGVYTVEREAQ